MESFQEKHTRGLTPGLSSCRRWIGCSRENFVPLVSGAKKFEVESSKTDLCYCWKSMETFYTRQYLERNDIFYNI